MTNRLDKVNALIATELGPVLSKHLGTPGMLATVTTVETAADLSESLVWISTVPDTAESWEAVEAVLPELRTHLATRLRMKRTPRLRLRHDHGPAHAEKIERLLSKER